jgi:Zn-dependent protease
MRQFASVLRIIFGFEALGALLLIRPFIRSALKAQAAAADLERTGSAAGTVLVLGLAFIISFGLVTGMAWWRLRGGGSSARAWSIAASIFNLFLFPLGTIAGIAGLITFCPRNAVAEAAQSPAKRHAPIPGDGTSKYSGPIFMMLQVAFMIVAGNWWVNWGKNQGLESQRLWIDLLEIEAAIFINVLCHELGHVFAGWATDMKLRTFVVGPLRFLCRNGKWGCELDLKGLLGGGAAGLVPTHLRDLRSRRVFMMAAGPVASLITAILATAVVLSAPGNPWAPAWQFFSALATFAWAAAVFNALPVRPENQYSDGAQIYQLLSNGPWADYHMAFSMVSSSLVTPLRPRDFDAAILNRAAVFMPAGQQGMLLNLFLYMHHCDGGRTTEGMHYFEIAESIYPQIAKEFDADLHLEFVYGNAVFKEDLAAAQLWWDRMEAKGKCRHKVDYWKARAALYWLEGSISHAREALQKADSGARQMPAAGAYDRDREQIAHLGAVLDAVEAPQPLPVPVS